MRQASKARRIASRGVRKPPKELTKITVFQNSSQSQIRPLQVSDDQQEVVDQLKEFAKSIQLAEDDDYYELEHRFLFHDPSTFKRYSKASKWKIEEAKERLEGTLKWRREYKPDLISPKEIEEETKTGKILLNGFDREGHPIVWIRPSRENTKTSPTQIRHMVFELERAVDLMPEGVEKVMIVLDYAGASASSNPPMSVVKEVVNILQNHYVERLGRAVVVNLPWYLNAFFKLVKPILDEETRQKLEFNIKLIKLVPKEQLDAQFGGLHKFEYDPEVYLPSLCDFCGLDKEGKRIREPRSHPDENNRPPDDDQALSRRNSTNANESTSNGTLVEPKMPTENHAPLSTPGLDQHNASRATLVDNSTSEDQHKRKYIWKAEQSLRNLCYKLHIIPHRNQKRKRSASTASTNHQEALTPADTPAEEVIPVELRANAKMMQNTAMTPAEKADVQEDLTGQRREASLSTESLALNEDDLARRVNVGPCKIATGKAETDNAELVVDRQQLERNLESTDELMFKVAN